MADQEEKQELEQVEQSVRDTEDELLKGAFEPPKKEEPPAPAEQAFQDQALAPPEGEAPKTERKRDPATGQFVKAGGEAAPAAEPQPPAQGAPPEQPEKPEEVLPSWRAREINEERRAAQQEAERLRVENARLAAWVAQQQRAAAPKVEPQAPDPVLDPAGYTKFVQDSLRREFAEKQMSDRLEMNLELTHAVHGEVFEKAFEAVCQQGQAGNNALVRHLTSQPNPGRAIIAWYNDMMVRREVGGDIDGFRQKTREQLLNDPTFLAEAAERARQVATGQVAPQSGQPGKPNTVVRLPPSLSKATGTSDMPTTSTDGSEEAIFANAFKQGRR